MVLRPEQLPHLVREAPNREFGVFQPRQLRQPLDTRREIGFGGAAQLFDAGFGLGGRKRGFTGIRAALRTQGLLDPVGLQVEELRPCGPKTPYGKETARPPYRAR